MSGPTDKVLNLSIKKILRDADLATLTSKKVRSSLEKQFQIDLFDRKKEIDKILMKLVEEATASKEQSGSSSQSSSDDDDDDSGSDEDQYTHVKKPKAKKLKDSEDSKEEKVKKRTGFGKEMILSKELAHLVGTDKLSRGEVVKKIYAVAKERDLYDPTNKQFVLCDDELHKIFGVKRFRAFGMMKHLKNHVIDPKDLV
eukprot:gene5218-5874_t